MFKKAILSLSIVLFICGCAGKHGTAPVKEKPLPGVKINVADETGHAYISSHRPVRIISTMPSNTEILFALGLKNRIVGVTEQCNYPPEARKIQKIGGTVLNKEKMIALNPDLIVMLGDAQKNDIEKLRDLRLPVFVINPQTLPELARSIRLIGIVTGAMKEADRLAGRMISDIYNISVSRKTKARPRIFVVLWDDPLITAGKGTFIDDLINLAGGVNIAADMKGKYPIMGFEALLEDDPDFLIIAGKSKDDIKKIKEKSRWKILNAVKNNRVLLIDSDIITRPSPRLVTALDLISNFIKKQEQK